MARGWFFLHVVLKVDSTTIVLPSQLLHQEASVPSMVA